MPKSWASGLRHFCPKGWGMKHNILLIDDEHTVRESTKNFLEQEGFFVKAVATGEEGYALIRQKIIPFSLALVDYHLADERGPEIINKIRSFDSNLHLDRKSVV